MIATRSTLKSRIFDALHRLQRKLTSRAIYRGLELYFDKSYMPKVKGALDLIAAVDKRLLARALKYTPTLVETFNGSEYRERFNAALINVRLKKSTLEVAQAIIHESTHGYLSKRRRIAYQGDVRRAHEFICLNEERRFLKKHALWQGMSNEDLLQYMKQWSEYHARVLETEWWKQPRRSRKTILRSLLRSIPG